MDYIETVTKGVAFLQQYMLPEGYALVRLNHGLTPDQAQEYEDVLHQLADELSVPPAEHR